MELTQSASVGKYGRKGPRAFGHPGILRSYMMGSAGTIPELRSRL